MQILIECLRSAKALGIAETDIHILGRIITDIGTGAENSLVHDTVFIHAPTDEETPLLVFPLILYVGACYVHHLVQWGGGIFLNQLLQAVARCGRVFGQGSIAVLLRIRRLVVQLVMIELNASGQVGRHEQALVKMINILDTQHTGKVRSHPISAVITIAHDVLSRSIGAERMFLVLRESCELEPTRIDRVLQLFHKSGCSGTIQVGILGYMGRQAETTSTTAEFLQMMVFKAQLGIGACTVVSIQTDSLVLQFRQFGETVSVGVPCRTMPALAVHISPHLTVRRNQGKIQGRVVVERAGTVEIGNGMRERTGIANRFLRNDIHRPGNG